ncbi:MAG: chitin disaccharide deacetylase [Cellulosilyticaceae bacterium]
MSKLIVNADDMGLCESVNYGIISAYQKGIVTSCTIMAGMPGFEHAIELLKQNPKLGTGVHMTLSLHRPVLENHKTIVDKEGKFHRRITSELLENVDLEEVYQEFCAQIEKVQNTGIEVSHLDSHHHVHTLKELAPVIKRITEKYKLPIRGGFEKDFGYTKAVALMDSFYAEEVTEDYFERHLDEIKKHDYVDLMCHPAFIEQYLVDATSYALPRMKEYSILTDQKVKAFLQNNGIEFVNYLDYSKAL